MQCDYHPKREAVEKCSRCNRLICLEDKQTLTASSATFGSIAGRSAGIYCSICYYDEVQDLASGPFSKTLAAGISIILLAFFGFFMLLFGLVLDAGSFLTFFFGGFMVVAIAVIWVVYFITNSLQQPPADLERAREVREKLERTRVDTEAPSSSGPSPAKSTAKSSHKSSATDIGENYQFCMNCGASIEPAEDTRCQSCGESIQPAK